MTRKLTTQERDHRMLDRWYARNPDDAHEYCVDDIVSRFQVSRDLAQAMYDRIQRDAYGS
jgi:hypothetical protein